MSAHTAPIDSETVKENLIAAHSEVALETLFTGENGFVKPHSPVDS